MKIGILQTGIVPEDLSPEFGEYPEMIAAWLQCVDPDLEFQVWPVLEGQFPPSPQICDAWVITGSKFGVYDPEPWIDPLKDFLRQIRAAGRPQIGICFGHQIMAEALGGRAVKSENGWGAGVHSYHAPTRPPWMQAIGESFHLYAMHQDQVVALPSDATVLASSPFCPNAIVAYGDPSAPDAISIQPHPEFPDAYAKALVDVRGPLMDQERWQTALESFGTPVARMDFAQWALDYLSTVRRHQPA